MSGSQLVTDKELGNLARIVSSENMAQIALLHFNMDMEDVERETGGLRENQWKYSFTVLRFWKRKEQQNATFKNLREAFSKAADQGLVDFRKVDEILHVTEAAAQGAGTSYDKPGQLTDQRLLSLSQLITEQEELRALALFGLNIPDHEVAKHFVDNRGSINTAAYNLLRDWRRTQRDEREAFDNMKAALEAVNMGFYVGKALV